MFIGEFICNSDFHTTFQSRFLQKRIKLRLPDDLSRLRVPHSDRGAVGQHHRGVVGLAVHPPLHLKGEKGAHEQK